MANGHGGARPGAGRPRKSLADKQLEGFPGKRRPKVLHFEGEAAPVQPPEWLRNYGESHAGRPTCDQIYQDTVAWLEQTGCAHLVNPEYISDYAIIKASWYEASRWITHLGLCYIPKTKEGDKSESLVQNPMVDVAAKYYKMANAAWHKIWSVVAQNSEMLLGDDPNNDMMSYLLNNKPGGKL
jgi:hypothetical protein